MVERPADRPGRQPTPADQPQCPQKPSDFCTDQPRPDKIMKKLSAVKCVVLTSSVRLHHTHNHIVQLLLLRSMGSDCPAVWRRGVSRLRFHTRRCCSTTGQLLHAPGAPDLPSAPEGESQLLHGGPGGTVEALQDCAEAALVQRPLVCSRRTVPPNARSTFLLVCSADGSHYATCHGDRTVRVFTRRGTLVRALGGHARSVWAAAFHPRDPATLASGCLGGVVRVWHEDTLIASWHASPPRPMPPPSGGSPLSPQRHPVSSLSFHPTDDTLAVACGSALYFWHTRSSPSSPSVRMVLTPSAAERVRFVKFSPCGDYLLTGVTNPPGLRVPHTPQLGLGAVPDLGISSETESDAPMETEPGAPCFMDPEPEAKCSMETALEAANALLKRQEAFRRSANAVRESEVSAGTAFRNVPGGVDLRDLMTLTAVGSLRPSSPPSTGEVSIGAASGPHPRASGSRNPTAPSGDPSGPWPHSFGGRDPSTPSGDPTLPNGASQEPQPPSFEFRDPTLLIGVPSDPSPRWGSDPSEPSLQGVLLNLLRTPVGCGAQPLPLRWPSDAVGPRYHGDPTLLGGGSGPPRTPPYTPFQPQLDPNSGVCLNFNCLARRFISDSASSNSSAASSTPSASPPLQRPDTWSDTRPLCRIQLWRVPAHGPPDLCDRTAGLVAGEAVLCNDPSVALPSHWGWVALLMGVPDPQHPRVLAVLSLLQTPQAPGVPLHSAHIYNTWTRPVSLSCSPTGRHLLLGYSLTQPIQSITPPDLVPLFQVLKLEKTGTISVLRTVEPRSFHWPPQVVRWRRRGRARGPPERGRPAPRWGESPGLGARLEGLHNGGRSVGPQGEVPQREVQPEERERAVPLGQLGPRGRWEVRPRGGREPPPPRVWLLSRLGDLPSCERPIRLNCCAWLGGGLGGALAVGTSEGEVFVFEYT